MRLGDRVIWRSKGYGSWSEKVGILVFVGPKGWVPEEAPEDPIHWLDVKWRDAVRNRMPDYSVLCRMFPAKGGGYCIPAGHPACPVETRYWTARQRYRFDRCLSGIVVAVDEHVQLGLETQRRTIKRPKRPLFYAPSIEAVRGNSKLKVWRKGRSRPTFKEGP